MRDSVQEIKTNELISVIVPVYNVSSYLRRCVDSVLNQTYDNLEIILVDDGSTDDSGAICDEYAKKDSRINVVHQHNQGLGPARNAGLEVMRGAYVAFVDSDDWIAPDMYKEMYLAIKNHDCDIATCGRLVVSDEGVLSRIYCSDEGKRLDNAEAVKHYLIQRDMNMSAWDKLFRSDLFEGVRFPGNYLISEDIVPMYLLLKKAKGVYLTGKPFYNYYFRLGSLSKSKFSYKTMGACTYAEQVAGRVKEDYPELSFEADFLYYDEVIGVYRVVRQSGYKGKEKKELRSVIKKNFKAIKKNPYLYKKQKVYAVLAIIGLDTVFDKLYTKRKLQKQLRQAKRSKD